MSRRPLLFHGWSDPRVKPPFGAAEIDWGHRLSRDVLFASVLPGVGFDLVRHRLATAQVPFVATSHGLGASFSGSNELSFASPNDAPGTSEVSMAVLANPISEATSRVIFARRQASSPFSQISLLSNTNQLLAASAGQMAPVARDSTSYTCDSTAGQIDGNYHLWLWVFRRGSGHLLYRDGQSVLNISNAGTPNITNTDPVTIGSGNGALYFNRTVVLAYYWRRALAVSEILELSHEPYAFLRPVARRTYFIPAAVVVVADFPYPVILRRRRR